MLHTCVYLNHDAVFSDTHTQLGPLSVSLWISALHSSKAITRINIKSIRLVFSSSKFTAVSSSRGVLYRSQRERKQPLGFRVAITLSIGHEQPSFTSFCSVLLIAWSTMTIVESRRHRRSSSLLCIGCNWLPYHIVQLSQVVQLSTPKNEGTGIATAQHSRSHCCSLPLIVGVVLLSKQQKPIFNEKLLVKCT